MSRIDDQISKSIVYLYQSITDAEEASPSGATGFIIKLPFESNSENDKRYHEYIVTNAHVIQNGIEAIRLNTLDGTSECLRLDDLKWYFHPDDDDLAVCPLSTLSIGFKQFDYEAIPHHMFITKDYLQRYDIGLGDEVFIVGRFQYHEGTERNLPSARFGNIAQMPIEKIKIKRSPSYIMYQEGFLLEMRSIGGYSGSPAFLVTYMGAPTRKFRIDLDMQNHTKLLGVDCGHLHLYEKVYDKEANQSIGRVKLNSAMSVVVPCWKLQELLNIDELGDMRFQIESSN